MLAGWRGFKISLDTLGYDACASKRSHANVDNTSNKLYVLTTVSGKVRQEEMVILTGTYSDIENLITVINETFKLAQHPDIVFTYSRRTSRVSISVARGKEVVLKKDSPGLVLGIGEIGTEKKITGTYSCPYAVDLSKGRRFVLLYTDLIGPSVEYEENEDSRVLKAFLIQTLNGINNYVFSKDDTRLMLPHENVSQITFWLKFNTGELITSGYPINLDLRIE